MDTFITLRAGLRARFNLGRILRISADSSANLFALQAIFRVLTERLLNEAPRHIPQSFAACSECVDTRRKTATLVPM